MKRLLFVLTVCFFIFSSSVFAFENGDYIDNYELHVDSTTWQYQWISDCDYYLVTNNGRIYFSHSPFTVPDDLSCIYWPDDERVFLYTVYGTDKLGNFTSNVLNVSPTEIRATNHNVYYADSDEIFFFVIPPLPPEAPASPGILGLIAEGLQAIPRMILQVIILAFSVVSLIFLGPLVRRLLLFLASIPRRS